MQHAERPGARREGPPHRPVRRAGLVRGALRRRWPSAGLERVAALQLEYSLVERNDRARAHALAQALGMAVSARGARSPAASSRASTSARRGGRRGGGAPAR